MIQWGYHCMGKQRKRKGQNPDQPDTTPEVDAEASAHVPALPSRLTNQLSDDESDDGSSPNHEQPLAAASVLPSASEVAEEHRQSIANILRSLTGSTERAPNGDELSAKLQRELMGQIINNYEIVGVVSSGGMGDVFSAVHTVMGRKAAIKVLRPEHCGDPALVQRFFNEARAANSIRHPNIVEVLDVGILPAGLPYITMELLEGETLAERLRRLGTMDIDQAVNFAVQASGALQAAHRQGIVHRDLKPDNLFIVPDPREAGRELIKILDFGIAKLHGDKRNKVQTNVGSILGTPPYMSPEQCRGIPDGVDHRSDVYALGVILFEMLCGAPPFVADGIGDVMVMHLSSPPPLPTWRRKEIPARIEQTILWALEKNPDTRIPSMADFAFALGVGPTPVPYLATPTGMTAPSFPPLARQLASVPPPSHYSGSIPPPRFNVDPASSDDSPPETAPPHDLLVTQYSSVHPPAVTAPSLPPQSVTDGAGGRSRWLTSIIFTSAAGLLIAMGGWIWSREPSASEHESRSAAHTGRLEAANRGRPADTLTPRLIEPSPAKSNAEPETTTSPEVAATASSDSTQSVATQGAGAEASADNVTSAQSATTGAGTAAATRPPTGRGRWYPARTSAAKDDAVAWRGEAASARPPSEAVQSESEAQAHSVSGAAAPGPAVLEGNTTVDSTPDKVAAPQTQATMGILNLAAAPWANVSLNGRNLGVTPLLNLRLPVGVHQLNLSNPELGKSTVVVVEISVDKPVSRFVGWHNGP
jgi:serine/threonine protein kinase